MHNREIADRLFLAESTIKSHVASSLAKLGVRSRKEAAALVLDPQEGLRALVLREGPEGARPVQALRCTNQPAQASVSDASPQQFG